MKIKQISIQGFRGFNEEQTIALHPELTLIAAPNSHGKTSISEAFEWLLYGYTSKVETADSKEEYRGSYRNCHVAEGSQTAVKVTIIDDTGERNLGAVLEEGDVRRSVNGEAVDQWFFYQDARDAPKPFILQHALKDLLLATPVDRFNRFAALLGLEELSVINKDLTAFCTKPPVPPPVRSLLADANSLNERIGANPKLGAVSKALSKALKKGPQELPAAIATARREARKRVPSETPDSALVRELAAYRDALVAKIFDRPVKLDPYTQAQDQAFRDDETFMLGLVTQDLIRSFASLVGLKSVQALTSRAQLLGLGIDFINTDPAVCPLCMQPIDSDVIKHIRHKHSEYSEQQSAFRQLENERTAVRSSLDRLRGIAAEYQQRHLRNAADCLLLESSLEQLESLLAPAHLSQLEAVRAVIASLAKAKGDTGEFHSRLSATIDTTLASLSDCTEDPAQMERLGSMLIDFVTSCRAFRACVSEHAPKVAEAAKIIRQQLDSLAGTQDISLLLELLEKETMVQKAARLTQILDDLKSLKAQVDSYTTETMLNAISGELTTDVMDWYGRIRTVGDPDVHFAGFDMRRTAQGGRVQIKASSYGKELVSAVSSLSESKLNALGLCISIATNLKKASPFDFLIIDDPIQSWDRDHEVQFVEVIAELVRRNKQIILLSHNGQWMRQVRQHCAALNGIFYEITGYTIDGPVIQEVPWVEPKQRLQAILAILEDQTADSTRLQHAEEEVRQVIHQLTCTLYNAVTGLKKSPHSLNTDEVRKMLLKCGVELDFVAKLVSVFETVDDAHHAAPGYEPNRQRIRQYHGWSSTLVEIVERKRKELKALAATATKA